MKELKIRFETTVDSIKRQSNNNNNKNTINYDRTVTDQIDFSDKML